MSCRNYRKFEYLKRIFDLRRFKPWRLLLVGDPKQLPPVVPDVPTSSFSSVSKVSSAGPNSSHVTAPADTTLFNRLQLNGVNPVLLNTQYRCHPEIANICGKIFYNNMLVNGIEASHRAPLIAYKRHGSSQTKRLLPPVCMVNVNNGKQEQNSSNNKSLTNEQEANLCVDFIVSLVTHQNIPPEKIGVICFYKAQANLIDEKMVAKLAHLDQEPSRCVPKTSTVDAFQGGECDIIILCTTRTKLSSNIKLQSDWSSEDQDFFSNPHRLNVAISRAKTHLVILCHVPLILELMNSPILAKGSMPNCWEEIYSIIGNSEDQYFPNSAKFYEKLDLN